MCEETLFHEALAIAPADRAAFLDAACLNQPALRQAVEALLAAHVASASLLDQPAVDPNLTGAYTPPPGGATGVHVPQEAQPGYVIAGRYTLEQKIGEGGMGEVWVAKQTEPVKRKVALKLIKAGMDSKAVLQRFEAERQALALMDHPNIAKVLDGGLTQDRHPFFVMELVNGLPLSKFCDEAKLTPQERLELFVPICQAVQHAHQKGIIHRDLKPGNILVTLIDGKPIPKVIDFGVAKATAGKLTDESLSTNFGAVVGTLEYMAPEQAGYSGEDIDTRADIYSLGVILYEMLTGLRPLDSKRLKKAALTEMIRIIREEEPSKPSTRLSTDEALPSLAASRQTEPKKLMALLRGELDWVVMKCLEKQRDRRYESVNGLARDIQRFLTDEVVEARPPSAGYRLQKFVRRYKVQVFAAASVVAALVVGVAAVVIVQSRANRDLAAKNDELAAQQKIVEARNKELADEQAKVQARFELAQQAIATFHTGVSEDALLKNAQFEELRTKLLKEAARFYGDLEKLLQGQADSKSRRLLAVGYFQLGDLTKSIGDQPAALAIHRKALALRRELAVQPGADVQTRLDVVHSMREVGTLLAATGELPEAVRAFEEQRELALVLEPESPTGSALEQAGRAYNWLGVLMERMGRPAEARANFDKALAASQKLTDTHPANPQFRAWLAQTHVNIGNLLIETGLLVEALAAHERAMAIRQKLADENRSVTKYQTDLAWSVINVADLQRKLGRPAEALVSHQKALAIFQKLVDAQPAVNHLQNALAVSHYFIGILLADIGQSEKAIAEYGKALAIQQRLADANPAVTDFQLRLATTLRSLGRHLSAQGQRAEAVAVYNKSAAVLQRLGDANPTVAGFQNELAVTESAIAWQWFEMGRPAEGLAMLHKARNRLQMLVDASPSVPRYQVDLGLIHNNLGYWLARTGRPAEALTAYEKSLGISRKLVDASPTNSAYRSSLAISHNNIGRLHAHEGRLAEAFAAFNTGLAIRQELVDANPTVAMYTEHLGYSYAYRGWARVRANQPKEAAADLRRAVELFAREKSADLETRFERSRALALLAGLSGDVKSGVTKDEAKTFADQAVVALADAIKVGWANRVELKEPDFEAIRGRADFQKLVAELEGKKPENHP